MHIYRLKMYKIYMKTTSIPKRLKKQTEPSGKLYSIVGAEASTL